MFVSDVCDMIRYLLTAVRYSPVGSGR